MTVSRLMLSAVAGLATLGCAAAAPDWATVPAKTITLFAPGQTSLEWLMSPAEHKGADKFRAGTTCVSCHTGQERPMGMTISSGKKNEGAPIPDKPGFIDAKVQVAHDAQNLYVRVEFADTGQPDAKMAKPTASVAMMLAGEGLPEAARAGCWAGCHDDSAGMPSAGASARTMYLGKTRAQLSRRGGGDALKPQAELTSLRTAGYTFEYWLVQLDLNAKPAASSGTVFDKRAEGKTAIVAEANRAGSTWSVTLTRKLNAGTVTLAPGKRYAVAFAIDAGHTAKRFHYVSFERSLVLDQGVADFVAK
ncbi:MAG TPA: ethylbenzene dehydrogenase-related protein [Rhizomicrobium sp.]|nr:ethylbenzene dehydrogenase-related protein [Rhizomicrobium sp.]